MSRLFLRKYAGGTFYREWRGGGIIALPSDLPAERREKPLCPMAISMGAPKGKVG